MKEPKKTYYVWRRSDTYVGASAYDPNTWQNKDTFDILLTTHDWDAARELVKTERAKMDNPFPWESK